MPDSSSLAELLRSAELKTLGRLRSASNVVLLCELDGRSSAAAAARREPERLCVYKPVDGERPLWDFPEGSLAGRELASYLISEALGWSLIPPTALRDGPYGWGMVQEWVRPREGVEDNLVGICLRDQVPLGWRVVLHARGENDEPVALAHADHPRLRQLAVLDVLLNNADRKGGHVLVGRCAGSAAAGVWGIDHGVCLNEDQKLRTVLWGWAGEPVLADQLVDLSRFASQLDGPLGEELAEHLSTEELVALAERAHQLLTDQVMPSPLSDRWLPWPLM